MNKWCYYYGGKLLGPDNSKAIAKLLINGDIDPHEQVLDMHTELWEPVARQREIMTEYRKLKQQGDSDSRGTYVSDSDKWLLSHCERLADNFTNNILPNRYPPVLFVIVMTLWEIWSFIKRRILGDDD